MRIITIIRTPDLTWRPLLHQHRYDAQRRRREGLGGTPRLDDTKNASSENMHACAL